MGFGLIYHFMLGMGGASIAPVAPSALCISNVTLRPVINAFFSVQPQLRIANVAVSPALTISDVSVVPPCKECC